MKKSASSAIPKRFQVSPATLYFDKFMTGLIMFGGIAIIVAVFFIFVFIGWKVIPLFRGAEVEFAQTMPLPDKNIISFGIDEWQEVPYFITDEGEIFFVDLELENKEHENRGIFTVDKPLPDGFVVSVTYHDMARDRLFIGSEDGRFVIKEIAYRPTYPRDQPGRIIVPEITSLPVLELGVAGHPIRRLFYNASDTRRLVAGVQEVNGENQFHAVTLTQRRTVLGVGPLQVDQRFDLTSFLRDVPKHVLVPQTADFILIGYVNGEVDYFRLRGNEVESFQTFTPFPEKDDGGFDLMTFVLGDESVIFFHPDGDMRAWNLAFLEEFSSRRFIPSHVFDPLPEAVTNFAPSRRNKTFLVTAGQFASLRLLTTTAIRWQQELPFTPRNAMIAPRYNALYFLDEENNFQIFDMVDDHPIAGFRTFFSRLQYEGRPGEIWDWQSDGGADFERKLSVVPLIIGTLKGTVYAMFIAVPVALLSAVYVSQFLRPSLKKVIKPTMEIMASLPSVILGFFAGMWLSPLISNNVPSVMMSIMGLVLGAFLMGLVWSNLPNRIRLRIPNGLEFVVVMAPALFVAWLGWSFGSMVENWLFLQYDDALEREVGSFRMWVVNALGWDFETRNALVVGFAMGFAVIPIIFTISEDSLSNVPKSFMSGSLALGASRWQTAMRIVVPTASAGIFSALMIGFGRAVGETMIMVMATGNAVVQDFNPFTGMRTLSANIAVEISEAEQNGTLYRTLFLCAFLLFVFTFTLNTIAEVLRQWLRKKYRAVE